MRLLVLLGSLAALAVGGAVATMVPAADVSTPTAPSDTVTNVGTAAPSSGTVSVQGIDSTGKTTAKVGPDGVSIQATDSSGSASVIVSSSKISVTVPDASVVVGPDGIEVTTGGQTMTVPSGGQMGSFSLRGLKLSTP